VKSHLAAILRAIENCDPSQHPELPEAAYAVRNQLVWHALVAANEAGIEAGIGWDERDPHPVVVYLELPTGQCSWHLPAHPVPYDGHTHEQKAGRIKAYAG
jgi:hypothetical protein